MMTEASRNIEKRCGFFFFFPLFFKEVDKS